MLAIARDGPTSCPKILGILPDPCVMARIDHPRDAGASVPFCQSSTREYKPREPFSHVKPPTEWRQFGPGLQIAARPSPRNYRTPHSGVSQPGIGHNEGTRPWRSRASTRCFEDQQEPLPSRWSQSSQTGGTRCSHPRCRTSGYPNHGGARRAPPLIRGGALNAAGSAANHI